MPTTSDYDLARERIDAAMRDHAFCQTCGAPMVIAVHPDGMWIECNSLSARRGILRLVARGLHERHPLNLPERLLTAA